MPNSLRPSSSEPSLNSHRPDSLFLRSISRLRPIIPQRLRRQLPIHPIRQPTPSYTPSQTPSNPPTPSSLASQPSPSPFSLLDTHNLPFTRRDLRLKFLQCGPGDHFTERINTRQEILAEIRQIDQTSEKLSLQSPANPVSRPTRSDNLFNPPSTSPLPRRRPHGAGRGTASVASRGRGPGNVSFTVPANTKRENLTALPWDGRVPSSQQSSGCRLTVRDMRQIDPSFTAKPAIWVREEALVVSLESVRAIILTDRMFLFDPDNEKVKTSLWNVRKRLTHNHEDAFMPFEFRALEGILIHACSFLERDFTAIEPDLRSTLIKLPSSCSNDELQRLHVLEQQLNQYYSRVRKVQQAIQTVLDEDEDMAEMYLTEKRKNPGIVRNPLDHDEAEMLLETYLQMVDDLTSRAGLLNQAIDDTENLIEIHLDTQQNRVLMVDLIITAITTTLSFATMIASIFGMNLRLPEALKELPTSHYYFWGAIFFMVVSMGAGLLLLMRWCRKAGLHSGRMQGSGRIRRSPKKLSRKGVESMHTKSRPSTSFGNAERREFVNKMDDVDDLLEGGNASLDVFKTGTSDIF